MPVQDGQVNHGLFLTGVDSDLILPRNRIPNIVQRFLAFGPPAQTKTCDTRGELSFLNVSSAEELSLALFPPMYPASTFPNFGLQIPHTLHGDILLDLYNAYLAGGGAADVNFQSSSLILTPKFSLVWGRGGVSSSLFCCMG